MLRLYYRSYTSAIAEELDLTRQAVGRHVRALEKDRLIQDDPIETEAWRQRLGGGTSAKWERLMVRSITPAAPATTQNGRRSWSRAQM